MYGLAAQGVFATVQGEGRLIGLPAVFVRFAACDVGCPGCDTDYAPARRVPLADLAREVFAAAPAACGWAWLTGGEPTLQPLGPLVAVLRRGGLRVAVATAGHRPNAKCGWAVREGPGGCDLLSVSPHAPRWAVRAGGQLNLVPGLNGLRLADVDEADAAGFAERYVTPLHAGAGVDRESLGECLAWVNARPGWRLGVQAHKLWGVP